MSDSTNQGGTGDFRGSREDKRKDETVMVNAEDLSEMVASAKEGAPVTEPTEPKNTSSGDDELADSQFGRYIVIAGIIAILIAVAIITYVNVIQ